MNGILDQIARRRGAFVTKSLDDVFAIQLARLLEDTVHLGLYLKLVPLYPHIVLADAVKRLLENGTQTPPLYERFCEELTQRRFRGPGRAADIIACKVERRSLTIALFNGPRLVFTQTRAVAANAESAERSATAFVKQTLADQPGASLAVETYDDADTRRDRLVGVVMTVAREEGVPVWEVSSADLLQAFAFPPCQTRKECRAIVTSLWPQLMPEDLRPAQADAVAIGTFVYARVLLHTEARKEAT